MYFVMILSAGEKTAITFPAETKFIFSLPKPYRLWCPNFQISNG